MLFNRLIFALMAAVLCTSLLFSCSSDLEMPTPPLKDKYSSSLSSSSATGGGSSSSGGGVAGTSGTFIDNRDSKPYKWVKIGEQIWMAENLNYNASDSRCYGDNSGGDSQGNCAKYGRLYDWATAMANVCPSGWHLPSDADWDKLIKTVGGLSTVGKHLKARDGWNISGAGTDDYGFSALPGGNGYSGGSFYGVGYYGNWWSSSEYSANGAYCRYMSYSNEDVLYSNIDKSRLQSVRCLRN